MNRQVTSESPASFVEPTPCGRDLGNIGDYALVSAVVASPLAKLVASFVGDYNKISFIIIFFRNIS